MNPTMNITTKIQAYIEQALNTVGYVCPSMGPIQCGTNGVVFKDVALDMGMDYAEVNKKTVMVRCKTV